MQTVQERVLAALMDPALHGNCPVRRIDTHAASVFLAGPRALKVKRAVRFPFLDYSTLAKRKAACDEELKINRAFAPQIYRRVVPITPHGESGFAVDGDGLPVEWAIEMARFDERQTLDHLAEAGPLSFDFTESVADIIVSSHENAPIAATGPWIDSISTIIERNTEAFRSAGYFAAEDITALDDASRSAFLRVRSILERRGRQGFVRRCHGDLHLANIVSIDGKPVLFDAIEFDPSIASIDVLYDLAFLLMDLLHSGQPEAANTVLNRYLAKTPEDNLDALASLPLFLSMRAAIRTLVLLARNERTENDRDSLRRAAQSYFELARRSVAPPPPRLIAVGGLSGTGKSVLARALAAPIEPLPGAVVLRSDVIRKQLFQVAETERLPATAYRPEQTQKVYRLIAARAARILSQGHSVIADAVYAHQSERATIARVASDLNVSFSGLFLTADLATRTKRISNRANDASDATPDIARRQDDYEIGPIDWAVIDASGTPDRTLTQSRAMLHEAVEPNP